MSVGQPYFEAMFAPILLPAVLLMALGPDSRWRETRLAQYIKPGAVAFAVAVLVLLGAALFNGYFSLLWAVGVVCAVFMAVATLAHAAVATRKAGANIPESGLLYRIRRLSLSYWGMVLAHLGVAVFEELASGYVIAIDAGDDHIAQAHVGDGAGQLGRFPGVQRIRAAVGAVAARPAGPAASASTYCGPGRWPPPPHGLLAESISYPDDYSSVTYRLRAQAKWHDGKPVTPEDVIFSLESFKKYHPQYSAYYRHVVKAEKVGDRDIKFSFDAPGNRELPQIVGQLNVLPKHWWEGTNAAGTKRDISATTLEPPIGSGPYVVDSFEAGRYISFRKNPDWWGKDLPFNRGMHNFDEVRYDYFGDGGVVFEAFKAGEITTFRETNPAKWASNYDFPAVQSGDVVKSEIPHGRPSGIEGLVFNTRQPIFADWRVRQALIE
eukprot:gene40650-54964_t